LYSFTISWFDYFLEFGGWNKRDEGKEMILFRETKVNKRCLWLSMCMCSVLHSPAFNARLNLPNRPGKLLSLLFLLMAQMGRCFHAPLVCGVIAGWPWHASLQCHNDNTQNLQDNKAHTYDRPTIQAASQMTKTYIKYIKRI